VLIFLDTELLWLLVHPGGGPEALELRRRVLRRVLSGDRIAVAEICDYEARRELMRKGAARQLSNMDELIKKNTYLALDTPTMRDAAKLWAELRQRGKPTAPDPALDGDVILGAQARRHMDHLVATANLRHLTQLCNAIDWRQL
jgi:predicted nucleic acid-binding protein